MRDIEKELRRLGESASGQSEAPVSLLPKHRRRIKLHRALFAAGGALTAIALVATASYGLGLAREARGIAPADGASSTLIRFERSGGFAGEHHVLTIERNGDAVLESPRSGGFMGPVRFELEPDAMVRLEDAVDRIDWGSLERQYRGVVPTVADGYVFDIAHGDYEVEVESSLLPQPPLRPLIDLLNRMMDERLGDAVDEPTLALSEAEVRSGDVVDLAIQASSDYVWGVLTSLEAEREGRWQQIAYWRTWPDRGPKLLRAITNLEGTVEAIGFSGSETFQLEIPRLDPGAYRITKEFNHSEGDDEDRDVLAEERFKVIADRQPVTEDEGRFAAIWPEDTYADAREACEAAAAEDADEEEGEENVVSIRSDPESVILEFGYEVLGWDQGETFHPRLDIPSDRTVYGLRRGDQRGASPREPEVIVSATEVQPGCWSVRSVSRMPDNRPSGVSIDVKGRQATVGFDTLGAAQGAVEIGYGAITGSARWVEAEAIDRPVRLLLDSEPETTGHFLILFQDEDGRVFSAAGGPLPAGDFSAG